MTFCIFLKKNCFYSPSGKDFFILYRFYVFYLCGSLWSLSVATHLKNFIFFYFETPERGGGEEGQRDVIVQKWQNASVSLCTCCVGMCVSVWVCGYACVRVNDGCLFTLMLYLIKTLNSHPSLTRTTKKWKVFHHRKTEKMLHWNVIFLTHISQSTFFYSVCIIVVICSIILLNNLNLPASSVC